MGSYFAVNNPNALRHAVAAHLFQFNLMRIASWNVNSAKARLGIIINWLKSDSCDVYYCKNKITG